MTHAYKLKIMATLCFVLGLLSFEEIVKGQERNTLPRNQSCRNAECSVGSSTHGLEGDEVVRLSPLNVGPGVIDTLSWRTLPDSWSSFSCSNPGDSIAIWFVPSAPCSLEAIRIHFVGGPCGPGNILLDICGSRYDGHLTTTDSTDANGWIGNFENGRWNPGWVLGHSPVGEHIWGPFPLSMDGSMLNTWVEISAARIWGKPYTDNDFFVTMAFFPMDKNICITMENQYTVPYHLFKYYAGCCGPDGVHDGWFIRSFSIWVEAIVSYHVNTPPEIRDMNVLNCTYAPGPYSVNAVIEDEDAEDPGLAGIASAYLHWKVGEMTDSAAMSGPSEGGTFSGQIPSEAVGDTVEYCISALDGAGRRSSNTPRTFARLKPLCSCADLLLVGYGQWWGNDDSEFYIQLLDSLGYAYEYWDIEKCHGIDRSVSLYGWRTVIIFGYPTFVPFSYIDPPIPTRGYEGNLWADFLSEGTSKIPVNLFNAESWYWDLNQEYGALTFQPGDFAYDYFGCVGADDCGGMGCTDKILYGVSGDPVSGDFVEEPFRQTWPLPFAQEYWMTYTTAAATGVNIFFTESSHGSGLRVDKVAYKTVFLPWDFYQLLEDTGTDTVPSEDVRMLMRNVLEWFGTETYLERGDINFDGLVNVLDVLVGANIILGIHDPSSSEYVRADCNGDREIDVTDLVGIVNVILDIGSCPP